MGPIDLNLPRGHWQGCMQADGEIEARHGGECKWNSFRRQTYLHQIGGRCLCVGACHDLPPSVDDFYRDGAR